MIIDRAMCEGVEGRPSASGGGLAEWVAESCAAGLRRVITGGRISSSISAQQIRLLIQANTLSFFFRY